jgi:hypothetical protein
MLPASLWQAWEPRVSFPAFSGAFNSYEFTVQPGLDCRKLKHFLYPLYLWRRNEIGWPEALARYRQLLKGAHITFRVYRLSANGEFLSELGRSKPVAIGETYIFQHDMRDARADEIILFVASRGRMDKFFSSPGNMTARYSTPKSVAGYRTGFFARPLNCGKKHYGYTGLNPGMPSDPRIRSGVLLINHSSDPAYNQSVSPVMRLYRGKDAYLERSFGAIPPHGFRELMVADAFPEAVEWRQARQPLWMVTECKGVTLASFHVYRDLEGQLLAIEHSRPSHAQVLDYWKAKKT